MGIAEEIGAEEIRIGTQGWNYEDWVGPFYPRGTRSGDFLDLYVRAFETVEIDSTFYAVPSEAAIRSWRARAPAGFSYALKLVREITHQERLHDCGDRLARFCDRVRGLEDRLGPILIQMPPDFSPRSFGALAAFLPLLPADLRFALEVRDRAWLGEEPGERLLGLLGAHRVALALTDGKWIPRERMLRLVDRPTAAFAYVRWLGPRELTDFSRLQRDRDRELRDWAGAFALLRRHVPLICGYFNNHFQGHAPASGNQFKRLIGQPVVEPEALVTQPSLF